MHGLLPIIRRVRRPLLPVDERGAAIAAPVPETVAVIAPAPVVIVEPAPPAEPVKPERSRKRVSHSPQSDSLREVPEKSNG